ncbi:hypothetical protein T492DRAFT_969022 [Pavlovales sp. CCMP2436]|nr:hypothetical protein T492DRAFT_969022 [Pavlovales sp. CCMP2436]
MSAALYSPKRSPAVAASSANGVRSASGRTHSCSSAVRRSGVPFRPQMPRADSSRRPYDCVRLGLGLVPLYANARVGRALA